MTLRIQEQSTLCKCGCREPISRNNIGKFAKFKSGHTDRLRSKWLPIEEAKDIIKSLNVSTTREYQSLYRHGKLPKELPGSPTKVYEGKGWTNWNDYLGKNRYIRTKSRLPFNEARKFARSLGFTSEDEWRDFCRSGKRPPNIPAAPVFVYKKEGWINFADFLGYERRRMKKGSAVPYEEAKMIIHTYKISGKEKFAELHKQGKIPEDIPAGPDRVYKDEGFSWPDFLGHNNRTKPLPFKEARKIARSLGIIGKEEYQELHRQGKLPKGMPSNPNTAYGKDRLTSD